MARIVIGALIAFIVMSIVASPLLAQDSDSRNAWLWFFLGLLFSVITVLVLLYKNSQDRAIAATS